MEQGFELYYREAGQGEPLVLLHGNGESSEYFAAQIEFFARQRRVLAVDTRGHGHSPRGDAPFALGQFADDLAAFLDARGLHSVDLLGFSDGGNIAVLFALKYPGRVRRLVLNGANIHPAGMKPTVLGQVLLEYAAARLAALFDAKARDRVEMLGLMVHEPHIRPSELGRLDMPVLVIVGERDMISDRHSQLICDSLPQGEIVRLPGDHFVAAGNAAAFNAAVDDFLRRSTGGWLPAGQHIEADNIGDR